jgi:hypothetical protein
VNELFAMPCVPIPEPAAEGMYNERCLYF